MTHTVVLKLPPRSNMATSWALFDDDTRAIVDKGVLAAGERMPLTEAIIPERTWVLVPGAAVTVRSIEIPSISESRAREAASFLLEDDVAVDRDSLHFALGKRIANRRLVAFTAQDEMEAWLASIAKMELTPTAFIPDFLVANAAENTVSVVEHEGVVMVCLADGGLTVERQTFSCFADGLLPAQGNIHVYTNDPVKLLSDELILSGRVTSAPALSDDEILETAYTVLSGSKPLNLLQGKYARRKKWSLPGAHWHRAATLAGVSVALAVALQLAGGIRLNNDAAAAYTRADALFHEVMPKGTRLVNARTQMRAQADEINAATSNTFLHVSGLLFAGVDAVEGAEIDSLRFDGVRREIAASLSLPSFDAMEEINSIISSSGGVVREGGARQQDERIVADITVQVP